MKQFKNRFLRSEFARNVAVVYSANTIAMVLQILFAPLITRLYGPADFAGFELYAKILALIVVVGSLRFELAIIIPKAADEAQGLLRLSFQILIVFTCISVLVIPFRHEIGSALRNSDLPFLLLFLPLGVLLQGTHNILSQVLIRLRAFKQISSNKILGAMGNNGFKYLFGLRNASAIGLTGGLILGTFIPILAFLRPVAVREQLQAGWKSRISRRFLFKKYRDFPFVSSFHAFFDEGQKTLLLFMISFFYSDLTLGLFAFTLRYLRVPVQVFGSSLSQVLNERMASTIQNGQSLRPIMSKTAWSLAAAGVIPFTVLFFFGEPIFGFVFGADWSVAGRYSEIIAPWLFMHFLVAPLSMLPMLLDRQRPFFVVTAAANGLALLALFFIATMGYDIEIALLAITWINVVLYIFMLVWFFTFCDRHVQPSN